MTSPTKDWLQRCAPDLLLLPHPTSFLLYGGASKQPPPVRKTKKVVVRQRPTHRVLLGPKGTGPLSFHRQKRGVTLLCETSLTRCPRL
uniref:Uncharacterized protein n=1 Tax=Cucumis melo TaxID=3656 RepID=A0A9I9D148_CUCME